MSVSLSFILSGCCSFRDVTESYQEMLGSIVLKNDDLWLHQVMEPSRCCGHIAFALDYGGYYTGNKPVAQLSRGTSLEIVQVFEQDFLIGRPHLMLILEAPISEADGSTQSVRAFAHPNRIEPHSAP